MHTASAMFLPAMLRPRAPLLTVENLVSAGSLASRAQSVGVFAFALEMLAKRFVHKSCKERTCLVPLVSTAGSLSETLRLNSESWNPELLYISRGQFIFSHTYLQFNYTTIQGMPLLNQKGGKGQLHREYLSSSSSFCYTLWHRMLLYISFNNHKP